MRKLLAAATLLVAISPSASADELNDKFAAVFTTATEIIAEERQKVEALNAFHASCRYDDACLTIWTNMVRDYISK